MYKHLRFKDWPHNQPLNFYCSVSGEQLYDDVRDQTPVTFCDGTETEILRLVGRFRDIMTNDKGWITKSEKALGFVQIPGTQVPQLTETEIRNIGEETVERHTLSCDRMSCARKIWIVADICPLLKTLLSIRWGSLAPLAHNELARLPFYSTLSLGAPCSLLRSATVIVDLS